MYKVVMRYHVCTCGKIMKRNVVSENWTPGTRDSPSSYQKSSRSVRDLNTPFKTPIVYTRKKTCLIESNLLDFM